MICCRYTYMVSEEWLKKIGGSKFFTFHSSLLPYFLYLCTQYLKTTFLWLHLLQTKS